MSPRRRNLLIAAAAIVAVGGIASAVNGNSDPTGQTADGSPTPSSASAPQTSPTTADAPTASSSVPSNATTPSGQASSLAGSAAPLLTIPSPDAAQTADLLARLGVISPVLARDEDKAVRRARNQCQDIAAGEPTEKLLSNAAYRFTTTGLETISTDQAQQILDAIEASFCPAP